jgi:hypothetical protein
MVQTEESSAVLPQKFGGGPHGLGKLRQDPYHYRRNIIFGII